MERKYTSDKGSVILTVVRSYDPKSVYHHPELAVSYHREAFEGVEVKRFSEHPEVPVHVLRPSSSAPVLGMYVLHYGSGFVEDPMSFQLRSALQLLFSKRQPMTLFFVVDNDRTGMGDAESSAASRVLFDAINAFIQ
jgi:hypothetical protein